MVTSLVLFVCCVFLWIRFLKYYIGTTNWCESKVKLNGKVALITGGNAGIGKETAIDLAKRGARVYIASRNEKRGLEAVQEIKEKSGNQDVHYKQLDLSDLEKVKEFAKEICTTENKLDILVNNAGIGDHATPSNGITGKKSKQYYNLTFGVNHLGHFLLTYMLLDLLKKAEKSRIVNVSSLRHHWRRRPFNFVRGPDVDGVLYPDLCGYSGSKLANVMHVRSLSKELAGTSVIANAVHPGVVATSMVLEPFTFWIPMVFAIPIRMFLRYVCLEPVGGAQTLIFAAVDESIGTVSGQYFGHCKQEAVNPIAMDENQCRLLWDHSLKMCGIFS